MGAACSRRKQAREAQHSAEAAFAIAEQRRLRKQESEAEAQSKTRSDGREKAGGGTIFSERRGGATNEGGSDDDAGISLEEACAHVERERHAHVMSDKDDGDPVETAPAQPTLQGVIRSDGPEASVRQQRADEWHSASAPFMHAQDKAFDDGEPLFKVQAMWHKPNWACGNAGDLQFAAGEIIDVCSTDHPGAGWWTGIIHTETGRSSGVFPSNFVQVAKGQAAEEHVAAANHLGSVREAQGDLAGAEILVEGALAIGRNKLGDDHFATLATANNLAVLCKNKGDLHRAEALMIEVTAGFTQTLGDAHPVAVSCADYLMSIRETLSGASDVTGMLPSTFVQVDEGQTVEKTGEQVVLETAQTGADVVPTRWCVENQAAAVRRTTEAETAVINVEADAAGDIRRLAAIVPAANIRQEAGRAESGHLMSLCCCIGFLILMAITWRFLVLMVGGTATTRNDGIGTATASPVLLWILFLGVYCVVAACGWDRCSQTRVCVNQQSWVPPRDSPQVFSRRAKRFQCSEEAEAAKLPLAVELVAKRRDLGDKHQATLVAIHVLAEIHYMTRDFATALTLMNEQLDGWTQTLGSEHLTTLICRANLAKVLLHYGDRVGAVRQMIETVFASRRVHGEKHPRTLSWIADLDAFQAPLVRAAVAIQRCFRRFRDTTLLDALEQNLASQLTSALVSCETNPAVAEAIARERTALEVELLKQKLKVERDLNSLLAEKMAEAQAQFDAALASIKGKTESAELTQQLMMEYEADRLKVIQDIKIARSRSRRVLEARLNAKKAEIAERHRAKLAAEAEAKGEDECSALFQRCLQTLRVYDEGIEYKQVEQTAEAVARTEAACIAAVDATIDPRLPDPVRDAQGTVIRVLDQVVVQGFAEESQQMELEGRQATVMKTTPSSTTVEIKLQDETVSCTVPSQHLIVVLQASQSLDMTALTSSELGEAAQPALTQLNLKLELETEADTASLGPQGSGPKSESQPDSDADLSDALDALEQEDDAREFPADIGGPLRPEEWLVRPGSFEPELRNARESTAG